MKNFIKYLFVFVLILSFVSGCNKEEKENNNNAANSENNIVITNPNNVEVNAYISDPLESIIIEAINNASNPIDVHVTIFCYDENNEILLNDDFDIYNLIKKKKYYRFSFLPFEEGTFKAFMPAKTEIIVTSKQNLEEPKLNDNVEFKYEKTTDGIKVILKNKSKEKIEFIEGSLIFYKNKKPVYFMYYDESKIEKSKYKTKKINVKSEIVYNDIKLFVYETK